MNLLPRVSARQLQSPKFAIAADKTDENVIYICQLLRLWLIDHFRFQLDLAKFVIAAVKIRKKISYIR